MPSCKSPATFWHGQFITLPLPHHHILLGYHHHRPWQFGESILVVTYYIMQSWKQRYKSKHHLNIKGLMLGNIMFLVCCSFFTILIRMGDIKWISPKPRNTSKTFYPPESCFLIMQPLLCHGNCRSSFLSLGIYCLKITPSYPLTLKANIWWGLVTLSCFK